MEAAAIDTESQETLRGESLSWRNRRKLFFIIREIEEIGEIGEIGEILENFFL